jgi:hypothetical protein
MTLALLRFAQPAKEGSREFPSTSLIAAKTLAARARCSSNALTHSNTQDTSACATTSEAG